MMLRRSVGASYILAWLWRDFYVGTATSSGSSVTPWKQVL